tara:strand:+ start:373 stop:495 length:123 start_codon:yes stop_codon:yes gene_type:complete
MNSFSESDIRAEQAILDDNLEIENEGGKKSRKESNYTLKS